MPLVSRTPGQEQAAPVGLCQVAHVQEDLVAEDVDVQLVGDVQDELHQPVVLLEDVLGRADERAGARAVRSVARGRGRAEIYAERE